MQLVIDASDQVRLEEPDDLRRFRLAVVDPAATPERVARALSGIGRLDGDTHAWIDEPALRRMGAKANDPAWQDGLSGMIAMARRYGFVDPETGAVRVHLEWAGRPADSKTASGT